MNRREALKNIGLSTGALVATPTLLSILQSCTRDIKLSWAPELLSEDEAKVLVRLVDLIIPETETLPGAKTLNVPMFVERFVSKATEKEKDIQLFKKMAETLNVTLGISQDNPVKKIETETLDALLSKYLKSSKEQQKTYKQQMSYIKTPADIEKISKDAQIFTYLSWVRGLSIWGFKSSKEIAEKGLNYLPVPGEYIGCDSVQNLTGGKGWAL